MATTVLFRGQPAELSGTPPQVGDTAPDFQLPASDGSKVSLSDSAGKIRILSVVPSVDTPVCAIETARFNHELDSLPDSVVGYTVSIDTPFALKRWCAAEGVEKMKLLSDFKGNKFSHDYGLYMVESGLVARCVFVIDKDGKIVYEELVPDISKEPDYQAVLDKARELANA